MILAIQLTPPKWHRCKNGDNDVKHEPQVEYQSVHLRELGANTGMEYKTTDSACNFKIQLDYMDQTRSIQVSVDLEGEILLAVYF